MPRWTAGLLSTVLIFVVAATMIRLWRVTAVQRQETVAIEQLVYLSDLAWTRATTGWLAIASDGFPARDRSFFGQPLRVTGESFARGLGTYPVSEIEYSVGGEYERFESSVGVDDEVPLGAGGVEFFVFVDDVLAFRSGVMRSGDVPKRISEPVDGADRLRLVVSDESGGANVNSADWGDARLVRGIVGEQDSEVSPPRPKSRPDAAQASAEAQRETAMLDTSASGDIAFLETVSIGPARGISSGYSSSRDELFMSNGQIAVTVGYGGPAHGTLTVYHLPTRRYVAYRVSPGLKLPSGPEIQLARDTVTIERGYTFSTVSEEVFGEGKQLLARFRGPNGTITQRVSLFKGASYLVLQMSVEGLPEGSSELDGRVRFNLLDPENGGFHLGDGVEYLTDYSRPRHNAVPDDGITRREAVGQGNPVFIHGSPQPQALILAALDETKSPTYFSIVRNPGTALVKLRLDSSELSDGAAEARDSSRLYLEVTDTDDPRTAFDQFKIVSRRISPPPPMPSWVKYQWLSWYVYGMDINEDVIRRQIDYIAENLADLGTWSILIDAGWYISEGREGADWRHVDENKFPSGLRKLVDYAHSRRQKVVLYFSSPYVDSRARQGDWLGLATLIKEHPEWLVSLGQDEERKSFALDYSNPGAREYVKDVLRDYFEKYDVDGIKIDGLGNADGALLDGERFDQFGLVDSVAGQTLEIYRFIYENAISFRKDAYIESGWMTPVLANRYAHTFRYGDEHPSFSNRYPAPGLSEHVDYAVLQKMALGQRPNMGAVFGDPNVSLVNLWWMQAGVALGAQTVVSFDLPAMTLETLSQYRSILAHYNAFQGRTFYERSINPGYFATTVGPTTYLGMLGRGEESRPVRVALSEIGVDGGNGVVAYDARANRFFKPRGQIRTELYPDSFRLYIIRTAPGVVWTNSSLHGEQSTESSFQVRVRGPRVIDGFAHIYAPQPKKVSIDGRELTLSLISMADDSHYAYDARTGIATLRYAHDRPHTIRIDYR